MRKIICTVITIVFIACAFAGCGSSHSSLDYEMGAASSSAAAEANNYTAGFSGGKSELSREYDAAAPQASAVEEAVLADSAPVPPDAGGGIAGPTVEQVQSTRKIIKNVDLNLQTMTFDAGVSEIDAMCESFGGYKQSSYVSGSDMYNERGTRNASFTLRIPSEKLDSFVNAVGNIFNVVSKSENSDDITESYYDSKARLDSLKIQETRLLAMLENATELEYMLLVEKELMNVRYEIESITSSLNRMDSYVSMSTVNINLSEVIKYDPVENVPVSFSQRLSRAFSSSWSDFVDFSQDFTIAIIYMLPGLIILAVIAIIVIAIIKKIAKRNKSKKTAPVQHPQMAPPMQAPPVYPAANNFDPNAAQQIQENTGEQKK